MILGCHVSFAKEQLLGSTKEALSYGADTFMFYTGAPQNTIRKEIDLELLKQAEELLEKNHIDKNKIICHAPYIINIANRKEEEKWQFSISFLENELSRCDTLGISSLVLHPGSSVGLPKEEALQNIIDALNLVLAKSHKCNILLETMAGKGTELGSLEDIQYIKKHVQYPLYVCLDTCHVNDAGYDLKDFSKFLTTFDQVIGLDSLKCVHLNDSKNAIGSHKDRHENIGYGTIGFETILNILKQEKLKDIPFILETPYVGKTKEDKERLYPPYKFEIQMLKNEVFDYELYEHIATYYNK